MKNKKDGKKNISNQFNLKQNFKKAIKTNYRPAIKTIRGNK